MQLFHISMVLSLHQQLIKAKLFIKIFSENSNFDDDHRSVHPFHGMVKLRLDTNSSDAQDKEKYCSSIARRHQIVFWQLFEISVTLVCRNLWNLFGNLLVGMFLFRYLKKLSIAFEFVNVWGETRGQCLPQFWLSFSSK